MKRSCFALVVLSIPSMFGCASLHEPKTPEGVDVRQLLAIELVADVDHMETLASLLPKDAKQERVDSADSFYFLSPLGRGEAEVHRSVGISRHPTEGDALSHYLDFKQTFTSGRWKLYEEGGRGSNRYFLAYESPWVDHNHGVPVGVVNDPEIMLAAQKRNLFISISYSAYRDDVEYVSAINADVAYVADLLRRSL